MKRQTTEKALVEIIAITLLFITIGYCVYCGVECKKSIGHLKEIKENEVTILIR